MVLMLPMLAQDHFHSILQRELAFLKGDFFDLFGFREVMLGGELLESIFELVMLGGELVEFLVRSAAVP